MMHNKHIKVNTTLYCSVFNLLKSLHFWSNADRYKILMCVLFGYILSYNHSAECFFMKVIVLETV
jgi:hypothetical protein